MEPIRFFSITEVNGIENKSMNSKDCYTLRGGFTSKESVSKTEQITLKGQIMTYSLTYTTSGNFNPKSSSLEEAL